MLLQVGKGPAVDTPARARIEGHLRLAARRVRRGHHSGRLPAEQQQVVPLQRLGLEHCGQRPRQCRDPDKGVHLLQRRHARLGHPAVKGKGCVRQVLLGAVCKLTDWQRQRAPGIEVRTRGTTLSIAGHQTHVEVAAASAGTRKFEGGRAEQGVSSTSVTDPTPARTMFLDTSAAKPVHPIMSMRAALSLQGARHEAFRMLSARVAAAGRAGSGNMLPSDHLPLLRLHAPYAQLTVIDRCLVLCELLWLPRCWGSTLLVLSGLCHLRWVGFRQMSHLDCAVVCWPNEEP